MAIMLGGRVLSGEQVNAGGELANAEQVPALVGEVIEGGSGAAAQVVDEGPGYVGGLPYEERAAVAAILANRAGIRLPETRVPAGDSFRPEGERAKRALQAEINTLPTVGEGIRAIRAVVAAEKHLDVAVPVSGIRMDPRDGGLYGKLKGRPDKVGSALAYTSSAFSDVGGFSKPASVRQGYASTLLALPPALRAPAFDYFADNAVRPASDEIKLRTALDVASGRRYIRAGVSGSYSEADDVSLASIIQASIPEGGRIRWTRGQDITEIEVIFPMMARQLVVGDLVHASIRIRGSETKRSGVRVGGQVCRALCYNFSRASVDLSDEGLSFRHVGEIKPKVAKAIREALGQIEPFVKAFGDAYAVALPGAQTRGEILGKVCAWAKLPVAVGEGAAARWDADGAKSAGNTLAGLHNALTAYAKSLEMEEALVIEAAASKVLVRGWAALGL